MSTRVQGVTSITAARNANIYACPLLQAAKSHMIKNFNLNVLGPKRDVAPKESPATLPSVRDHIHLLATYSRHPFTAGLSRPKTCCFRWFLRF